MTADGRLHELDARAVALVIGCAGLWGLGQVAAKVGLAEIPPLLQAALRSLGASVLLLGWCAWRRLPLFTRDGTTAGGIAAGLLFAAEFGCIFSGLQFTTASRLTVFLYTAPFIVALGMPLLSRTERLHPTQAGGLALAFAGVVWAFAEGFTRPAAGAQQWLGDALGLAAATFWGLTTLTVRGTRLSAASAEKTLLYQLLVSGAALAAASAWRGEALPPALSALSWGVLGFQTVLITFASYLVWFWLVRHYPATKISSFTLLTPLFGLLAGVLLLGEPLTARLALALLAVCAGIWLVNRPKPGG